MTFSFKVALTGLIALIVCLQSCLSQQVSIASPAKGSTVTAGRKLSIVLKIENTSSSLEYLAFSTAFRTLKYQDPTSLGYPYLGTVFPGKDRNVTFDSAKLTFNYQVTVPDASHFTEPSLPSNYQLTVSTYYLLGATSTPEVQLTDVEVKIEK